MNKSAIKLLCSLFILAMLIGLAQCTGSKNINKNDSNKGLKDYYKDYFTMGVAVSPQGLKREDEAGIVKQHFTSMTAENAMKMGPIHPRENFYKLKRSQSILS